MKTQHHTARNWALSLALVCAAGSAMAQWQWIDADGRKIFSDKAPPSSVPESQILRDGNGRPYTPVGKAKAQTAADEKAPTYGFKEYDPAAAAAASASAAAAAKAPAKGQKAAAKTPQELAQEKKAEADRLAKEAEAKAVAESVAKQRAEDQAKAQADAEERSKARAESRANAANSSASAPANINLEKGIKGLQ